MKKAAFIAFAVGMTASLQVLADTDFMFCFGGSQAGLYYSAIFPVPHGTSDTERAKAFSAFVNGKYGAPIYAECHSNMTPAFAQSAMKGRKDSDQKSKYPSKLVETGWKGM